MSGLERNKYKIAGPQTWELVRAAYLAGDSARVVAERYGVTIAAIRRRACKEKWTKRHLADALEARGIAPPPPPAAPDYVEPHIERAAQRIAADEEREAEMTSLVDRIAAEEDAADIAAALERRALAQASAAMVQGRSKEAQALASMAEMMRKRVVAVPAAAPLVVQREAAFASPAELERRALAKLDEALARGDAAEAKALTAVAEQMRRRVEEARAAEVAAQQVEEEREEDLENRILDIFRLAAHVASAMVHQPTTSPAVFLRMVKRWRELNLGEGEADAEKRAAVIAGALARHIEGRSEEDLPEDVRAYAAARWDETRARLERNEPVAVLKKSEIFGAGTPSDGSRVTGDTASAAVALHTGSASAWGNPLRAGRGQARRLGLGESRNEEGSMRQFLVAAAAALALAACGAGADGPALPQVKAGATPPSTQSPASPTQQAQVTDEVRQQLITGIGQQLTQLQGANAPNYSQVGADTIIPMQPGRDHRFLVDLTAGTEYGFIGTCDGDCSNVDIELISMETGGVVANDMLPDNYPIFPYTPTANGQYMVRILMQACTTAPCYAGARVVSNAPAAAPAGGGGATTGGGGTPGKP